MNRLKHWWQTRQTREKRLVAIASAIICLALLSSGLQQVQNWRAHAERMLAQEQAGLSAFSELEQAIARRLMPAFPSLAKLQTLAAGHSLTLALKQEGNRYQMTAPAVVPFQALFSWLEQLESCCGLRPVQLELERHEQQIKLLKLELQHGA